MTASARADSSVSAVEKSRSLGRRSRSVCRANGTVAPPPACAAVFCRRVLFFAALFSLPCLCCFFFNLQISLLPWLPISSSPSAGETRSTLLPASSVSAPQPHAGRKLASDGFPRFFSFSLESLHTFEHDAAAPASSRGAAARYGSRLPPFTQALLPSPFQPALSELRRQVAAASRGALSADADACLEAFGGASVLVESSGLYEASFLREFDFCTGQTLRKVFLHPSLFAEGVAYLWDAEKQQLLLLLLTWLENRLVILDGLSWEEVAQLQVQFEGWGLASSLTSDDAALAVAHLSSSASRHRRPRPPSSTASSSSFIPPEAGDALAPEEMQRLQRQVANQRLWATTGSDLLLELDVPSLFAAIRRSEASRRLQQSGEPLSAAPSFSPSSFPFDPSSPSASYVVAGGVNEDMSTAPAPVSSSEAPVSSRQANALLRLGSLLVGGATAGVDDLQKKMEDLATVVEAEKKRKPATVVSEEAYALPRGPAGSAALAASALPPVRTLPLVALKRQTQITCLGRPVPQVNELEFLPHTGSLLGNIYGESVLVEFNVDTGNCRGLLSFGGVAGVLRSSDRSVKVMNGVSLLPRRQVRAASPLTASPPLPTSKASRRWRRLAESPLAVAVTGKHWHELHVAELVELLPPRSLKSYSEVHRVFPGFFHREGVART
ncbi:glutamine cyclotransferase [Toxoplasma gondii RUB]|uniref:Glutamine cyclotransferase n=1 Tax=Toxoplasma gondii RUB TaxID=935652 RepID=A0A086M860_TOXGO|nr:glutamine cyclotransferase [Toxoplasma gondii RUB]